MLQMYLFFENINQQTVLIISILINVVIGLFFIIRYFLNPRIKDQEHDQLKKLDEVKSKLYTNITHEFRTPLTVIIGMTEQITGNEEAKKLVLQNSKTLLRLINQMLDLSKIDAGHMTINWVQGNIIEFLKYILESFKSLAAAKNIRLLFYSEIEEFIMDYDEDKIQQILSNLISNGIKFTPEDGQVVLHLQVQNNKAQEFLVVKVKDSGIGIRPEVIPHIFDRFFQVEDLSTYRSRGTGIGLALTKELVHLLGGKISVNSEANKGSTFEITLPVHHHAQRQVIPKALPEEVAPLEKVYSTDSDQEKDEEDKPLLLLIEDNADVVTYICSMLRALYRIEVAENGQVGLDKAFEIIPDIVVSDVMMPLKDGYEVCHVLKSDQRTSHIPVILLTAKATQEDRISGLQKGADAYLTKPFSKEELLVRLQKLIELRQDLQNQLGGKAPSYLQKPKSKQTPEEMFLQKLHLAVEKHMDDTDLEIRHLCRAAHLSHTQVYRKLKALTGKTPSQFIRSIRLNKALQLLQDSNFSVSEVAYETGFKDPAYFSRVFTKAFGNAPSAIRK